MVAGTLRDARLSGQWAFLFLWLRSGAHVTVGTVVCARRRTTAHTQSAYAAASAHRRAHTTAGTAIEWALACVDALLGPAKAAEVAAGLHLHPAQLGGLGIASNM